MKKSFLPAFLLFVLFTQRIAVAQPASMELQQTYNCNSKVEYITFSPDGSTIAAAAHNGNIYLWNTNAPETQTPKVLSGHNALVNHIEFSKSGKWLASASNDGTVILWNAATFTEIKRWQTAQSASLFKEAYFVVFSPNEQNVYFGGKFKKIKSGTTEGTDTQTQTLFEGNFDITIARTSPDGKFLAFANGFAISFLNLQTGEVAKNINEHITDYINDIAFSNDGKQLVAWCEKGVILLWDYPYCSFIKTLDAGNKGYSHLAFNNNNQLLASGNLGPAFRIWNLANGKFTEVNKHSSKVNAFAFNPANNNLLATASYDKTIKLWSLNNEPPAPPAPTPPAEEPTPPDPQPVAEVNNRQVIPKGTFTVGSPNITINIWDDRREDGDVVSLYYNDQCVLEQYTLVNQVRTIKLTLGLNRINTLTLFAHNLGAQPPNTAAISIFDGKHTRRITLSSDFEGSEAIHIVYQPE
ncbi:WD40 repeat domain-containing protein [Sphingobacteriales bacterium UPWRP_1]|nr:hypothetical protein BVG80_06590 [Sphingobacteriales bacterium TSM_CSM]PSJ78077.1 WD40 repeat domain-containing protein [Sphingobacteriales bacterium UPWRP_1]